MKSAQFCYPTSSAAFLILLLMTLPAFAADDQPWDRKLPFENATISYEISGMETGSETLYIKDHGLYRAKHHEGTTRILGMSTLTRTLDITDPDWFYTFDLEGKTGTKLTNPRIFYQEEYEKLTDSEKKNVQKNSEELGMSMVRDFNGQIEQNAVELLGYSCDRTTIMGMQIDVIHGTDVALMSEMNIMGMKAKIAATAIDTGKPSEDVFAMPADITPVHDQQGDDMARQMVASAINTLKEPDGAEKMRAKMSGSSQGALPSAPQQHEDQQQQDPAATEEEVQQGVMDESMQQGLNMLKGLFGN